MVNLFVAKSLILINVFCMQGCTVTVASHPPFDAAIGNNTLPVTQARGGPVSPVISPIAIKQDSATTQAPEIVGSEPVGGRIMRYKMDFSDYILNSVTQLLMLCAMGGKCK